MSSFRHTGRSRCVLFMHIDISVPLYKLSINVVLNIYIFPLITHQLQCIHSAMHPSLSQLYCVLLAFYKLWSLVMSPKHLSVVPSNLHECQQGQKAGSIDIPLIITHNDNNMKLPRVTSGTFSFFNFLFSLHGLLLSLSDCSMGTQLSLKVIFCQVLLKNVTFWHMTCIIYSASGVQSIICQKKEKNNYIYIYIYIHYWNLKIK